MNWTSTILNTLRAWFSLDADTTEAEIHAAMENTDIKQIMDEKQALENRVEQLNLDIDALRARVTQYEADAATLLAQIKSLEAENERLKKEPAALHTGGDTLPGSTQPAGSGKSYLQTPIYLQTKRKNNQ